MKYNNWTADEINILKSSWKNHTGSQLAYMIPRHSKASIHKQRQKLGFVLSKNDRLWRSDNAQRYVDRNKKCKTDQSLRLEDLDCLTYQMLMGSMLGDGCCGKQTPSQQNHRFTEVHCLDQTEYVRWKAERFAIFKPVVHVRKYRSDFITGTHPIFSILRSKFYPEGIRQKKQFLPLDLLTNLSLFGLMVWYLDDGNIGTGRSQIRKPQPSISAKGWMLDDLQALVRQINDKLNLSLYVYTCKHKNGINKLVKIPAANRDSLLGTWIELAVDANLPQSMFYKFGREKCQRNTNINGY